MASIFSLSAELKLDDASFKKGVNNAEKSMKNLDSVTSSKTKSMSSSWGVMTVAIGNMVSKAFSTINSIISSSLSGAIARVDTLNSYSIVMEGLGFSAEQAKTEVNKLSDGIQGLPTTLPQIVTLQKQYSALTGDMSKATEITLALNNAVVAGGQGQEVANSALNQWYQMIANGKPDMQSWRIINQAMPAQLDQIAKTLLGATAKGQDLFTAWKDGKITTDQLTSAMIKLSKEGGAGFESFQKQALNASKGIQTSMANVRTKVVTVMGNMIQAMIDRGLDIAGMLDSVKSGLGDLGNAWTEQIKTMDFKELSSNVSELVKTIFDGLKKINIKDFLQNSIKGVTNFVRFVVDNGEKIVAVMKIVAKIWVTMKVYEKVKKVQKVMGDMYTDVKKVGDAFVNLSENGVSALNKIGSKGKLGAFISGFGGAVASVSALAVALTGLVVILESLDVEYYGQIGALKKLSEEAKNASTSYDEMHEASEKEAQAIESQYGYYEQLVEQLKACYDENGNLKEGEEERAKFIMGELNEALGTEYDATKLTKEELANATTELYKNIEAMKAKALFKAYEDDYTEAVKKQKTEIERLREAEKKLSEAQQEMNRYTDKSGNILGEWTLEASKANAKLSEAQTAWDNAKEAVRKNTMDISTYQEAMVQNQKGNTDEAVRILQNYGAGYSTVVSGISDSTQRMSNSSTAYMAEMLRQAGVSESEIVAICKRLPSEANIVGEMRYQGTMAGNGFYEGINSSLGKVASTVGSRINDIINTVSSKLKINSPSKVFRSFGDSTGEGYEIGAERSLKKARNTIDGLLTFDDSIIDMGNVSTAFSNSSQSAMFASSSASSSKIESLLNTLLVKLDTLGNQQIVLDTGVLVGETASKMDAQLGMLASRNERGVFV